MTRRTILAAIAAVFAAATVSAADMEAKRSRLSGRVESHWHIGPFFEYRRAAPGASTFWAVRPFWSSVSDAASDTDVCDALWPLGTWHRHRSASWWRAVNAYGSARGDTPEWSATFFPLAFGGRERGGDAYWGVFPLYGNHPHLLFMDDWNFVLWPLWQTYTVKDVRSRAVLWPLVTWRDSPRSGVGVWPFFGKATLRESRHSYCLWPFVTWSEYDEDRDTGGEGSSWMVWPFCGRISRAREEQTLVLPPFFSFARTPSAERWRLPWPLFELERSRIRDRLSVWPFYESVDGYSYRLGKRGPREERTRRYGWYLVEDMELDSARSLHSRFTVFPFWTDEVRWTKTSSGAYVSAGRFCRVWPFWSMADDGDGCVRHRVLDLNPIRHSEGIDRNWAPFWTFYESRVRADGRVRHSLFWNLVVWHTSP